MIKLISKSDFLIYKECASHFWFWKNKSEVLPKQEEDLFAERLKQQGQLVEQEVIKLFPDGKAITHYGVEAVTQTKALIASGTQTIFQATFIEDGLLAMIDILVWNELYQAWDIYEVKSSSSQDKAKKQHIIDATFQKLVVEKAGLKVVNVYLIELNKDYIKEGTLNIEELFATKEITTEVQENEEQVLTDITLAKGVLSGIEPTSCGCQYKGRSRQCPAFTYLYPNVPEYSVYDLTRIGQSKNKLKALVDDGILAIEDLNESHDLSAKHQNQWLVHMNQEPMIDLQAIRDSLDQLVFPIYFLDYETLSTAIPNYDYTFPYQQVVFQYSLHILHEDGSLEHKEFLHDSKETPVHLVAKQLREDIGDTGSIVVWNKGFESTCHKDLTKFNPDLESFLLSLNQRMYDLMEIFSKQYYLDYAFKGRYSIKKVLPVLCPELSYGDLDISNGSLACIKYEEAIFTDITFAEKEKIFKNLLAYCELDTLAMVRIYEVLLDLVGYYGKGLF